MGAYAEPSNQPFMTDKPLKTKRKRGRIDDLMELMNGKRIDIDPKTNKLVLMQEDKVIAVFDEDVCKEIDWGEPTGNEVF